MRQSPSFRFLNMLRMAPVHVVALGLAAIVSSPGAQAKNDTVVIQVEQARVVKVPDGTQTLVIGNPNVADVTLLKNNNTLILTGRGFGQTNLFALDGDGNPLAESTLRVVADNYKLVVQRGFSRESFSCAPRCEPTATLGDDMEFATKQIGNSSVLTGGGRK